MVPRIAFHCKGSIPFHFVVLQRMVKYFQMTNNWKIAVIFLLECNGINFHDIHALCYEINAGKLFFHHSLIELWVGGLFFNSSGYDMCVHVRSFYGGINSWGVCYLPSSRGTFHSCLIRRVKIKGCYLSNVAGGLLWVGELGENA